VGEGLDSLVFITIAFAGVIPGGSIFQAVLFQWLAKSAYEAAATPLTYAAVRFLKTREGMDTYDRHTRFGPFRVLG
jgi:hypothetical protein